MKEVLLLTLIFPTYPDIYSGYQYCIYDHFKDHICFCYSGGKMIIKTVFSFQVPIVCLKYLNSSQTHSILCNSHQKQETSIRRGYNNCVFSLLLIQFIVPKTTLNWPLIGGLAGAGLFVLVIIVMVVMVIRKRKGQPQFEEKLELRNRGQVVAGQSDQPCFQGLSSSLPPKQVRGYPHLVPGDQCLASGTKSCCFTL